MAAWLEVQPRRLAWPPAWSEAERIPVTGRGNVPAGTVWQSAAPSAASEICGAIVGNPAIVRAVIGADRVLPAGVERRYDPA